MSTPCIILSRDRLSTLEKLVDQLLLLGYDDLYVLDMDSSYPPLLEYLDTCKDFTVIRHHNRSGHKALWTDDILKELFSQHPWVAVSDSDIELSPETPRGFIEDMICVAKDFRVTKCGLAIRYQDITNQYLKSIIDRVEENYWNRLPHSKYLVLQAPVDTTMCVVQPLQPFTYTAVRLGDYPCIHTDWYQDWSNLTEEQQYYMDHTDERVATTKQHYLAWRTTQV